MQAVRSYMTPPIAALFLLAMFCKRVNEQGAFWGLILGSLIGIVRMAADLAYGSLSCTKRSRCLTFICELHYLYFSVLLFVVTLLIMVGVSLATDPISDEYLYRLCWSLRNSTEERTDLDAEVRKIRFPGHRERPGVYEQDRNCFWNIWELFCGLDSYPGPKLVPEKTAEETEEASEKVQVTEGKTEAPEEELEGKAHGPVSRKRFWRNFVNANAVILFIIVVITHICFA
ncbi:Sodium/glucose cotransporter 1 [Tupaia chinensis]|uniref:Sodium/glucose cotransporter 1 n=2 Tax=Tupaia chinensis TaxID=246437 RepID=L9JH26_TUPCH|nr:Sodium/glucose cotransporter 1 [Tupaia chinensis]